jgi:hypothetical protein
MTVKLIPATFLDMLPLPILIANIGKDELNPPLVFLNRRFIEEFGWTLRDIPDKKSWSKKAYPNADYERVVNKQWDLEKASVREADQGFVKIEVNIMTAYKLQKRFIIYTQIDSLLIPKHHVLAFERVSEPHSEAAVNN